MDTELTDDDLAAIRRSAEKGCIAHPPCVLALLNTIDALKEEVDGLRADAAWRRGFEGF